MTKRITPTLAICAAVAAVAILGLFRSGDTTPAAPAEAAAVTTTAAPAPAGDPIITIDNFSYSGAGAASAGQTVRVDNVDGAPHTVTARDGSFDSGILQPGQAGEVTLPAEPGTYEFFCTLHPSMVATITVGA